MKIDQRRAAISQSLDLFIIIGAVLAVGGVVTSSVFGLVNGNSQNTAFQVTSISATGGTGGASGTLVNSFNIVLKNIGSSSIKGPMAITLVGANGGASPPSCTSVAPTVVTTSGSTAGANWSVACSTNASVTINGPSTGTATLAPGGQISVSVGSIPSSATGTPWAPGVVQTVTITFGVASASATVTS